MSNLEHTWIIEIITLNSQQNVHNQLFTYLVAMSSNAHQEVVWLDISMDKTFAVNVFYTANHLISQHKDCLNSKPPRTEVEQIFEWWAQQIHDQDIVFSLQAVPSEWK